MELSTKHVLIDDLVTICMARQSSIPGTTELIDFILKNPTIVTFSDLESMSTDLQNTSIDAYNFYKEIKASFERVITKNNKNPEEKRAPIYTVDTNFDFCGCCGEKAEEQFGEFLTRVREKSLARNLPAYSLTSSKTSIVVTCLEGDNAHSQLTVAKVLLFAQTVSVRKTAANNLKVQVGISRADDQKNVMRAISFFDMMAAINFARECEISSCPAGDKTPIQAAIFDYNLSEKLEIVKEQMPKILKKLESKGNAARFILHPICMENDSIVKSVTKPGKKNSINMKNARERLALMLAYYTPIIYLQNGLLKKQDVWTVDQRTKKLIKKRATPLDAYFINPNV